MRKRVVFGQKKQILKRFNMAVRRKKKSKDNNPMPATGAGLIRFYSEADSPGIRLGPIATVLFSIILIVVILIANIIIKP